MYEVYGLVDGKDTMLCTATTYAMAELVVDDAILQGYKSVYIKEPPSADTF